MEAADHHPPGAPIRLPPGTRADTDALGSEYGRTIQSARTPPLKQAARSGNGSAYMMGKGR